jgi:Flp pilus assembly protein TadG
MKHPNKQESGQSIILVAFALITFIALLALVVDAGNAYVQERQVQNAIDASSQAGALATAQQMTDGQVSTQVNKFLTSNGVDPTKIQAYYVVQNASGNYLVASSKTVGSYGANNVITQTQVGGTMLPVVGVQVQGNKSFNTFFAGVLGWKQMQVGAGSMSFGLCGASGVNDLFPIAISSQTFTNGQVVFKQNNPTYFYRIYENYPTNSLNYVYVTWNSDTTDGNLNANMADVTNSGTWVTGQVLTKVTDSMYGSSNVYSKLTGLDASGDFITIPVYDSSQGGYHIKGFARAQITNVYKGQNGTGGVYGYIDVQFSTWVDATGDAPTGGAANYGVCTVKTRQPTNPQRLLTGTVSLQQVTITQGQPATQHVPVDVVNVLDISGSMSDSFGSQTKLQAAKSALTSFNSHMQPDNPTAGQGDQVGLVTFPTTPSGSRYNYSCTQSGSTTTYYFAQQVDALTRGIANVNTHINSLSANGGTPLAAGLQQGLQTVLGAGHSSSRPAVIIVASDGLTNIRLNGQWTGFQGNTFSAPSCNDPAVQDAIDQANIAKGDTNPHDGKPDVTIFSIAVGTDFNPSLLQAIKSTDTSSSGPHYYTATDANSMANIYQQIGAQVQDIGNQTCGTIQTTGFAGGANLVVKNLNTGISYNLQTTSAGQFELLNADPGRYEFQSATVTINGYVYNVFTQFVGGPPLSSLPYVDVEVGDGTYKDDLYLKTTTNITCQ